MPSEADFKAFIDESTGEVIDFKKSLSGAYEAIRDIDQFRIDRYMIQSVVRQILPLELPKPMKSSKPTWRVRTHDCLRKPAYTAELKTSGQGRNDNIEIAKSNKTGKAHFNNLAVCGSVHICPTCRARLDSRRSEELQGAIDMHMSQTGGDVIMGTFTVPHGLGDDLSTILRLLKKTYSGFKELRGVKNVRIDIGEKKYGSFSTTEFTWSGRNGWHPHIHVLFFVKPNVDIKEVQKVLSLAWQKYCVKKNLGEPSLERGVHLQSGKDYADRLASYMSKGSDVKAANDKNWSMAKEVTFAGAKSSKSKKGLNPFQILRTWAEDDDEDVRSKMANLFREYAIATSGIHVYDVTKSLKNNYLNDYIDSDEDAAIEKNEDNTSIGFLSFWEWQKVLNVPFSTKTEARMIVLLLVEKGGIEAAKIYIDGLPNPKPKTNKQKIFFDRLESDHKRN